MRSPSHQFQRGLGVFQPLLLLRLVSFRGSSTFSNADSTESGEGLKDETDVPVRQRATARSESARRFSPSTRIRHPWPSIAATRCSNVDLPEPDDPSARRTRPCELRYPRLQRDDMELVADEFLVTDLSR